MIKIARRVQASISYRTRKALGWLPPPPPPPVEVMVGFDHSKAQVFELDHNAQTIESDFARVYAEAAENEAVGGLWQSASDQWFQGDESLFQQFVEHVRERKVLEIGPGPFGHIAPCYWMKDRAVIEPLVDRYRELQIKAAGETFFTDKIKAYAQPAEVVIDELIGAVDGAIICRNALDHCEDPLAVLYNLGKYAAPGAWLLLWTDIWHLEGHDDGHQSITKSPEVFETFLRAVGFEVVKRGAQVRDGRGYIEYGCIAKRQGT